MGNFHCIPESCARVVWREYLPAVVRWRYEGEDWQEIEADDYAIASDIGACPVKYHAFGSFFSRNLSNVGCDITAYWRTSYSLTGSEVESFSPVLINGYWVIRLLNGRTSRLRYIGKDGYDITELQNAAGQFFQHRPVRLSCLNTTSSVAAADVELIEVVRVDGGDDNCGDCVLTITKDGQTVYTETRTDCPEVEQLPCRLSDESKEIKIEKTAYLSAIEISEFARDAEKVNGVPFPLPTVRPIPSECLNIYRNEIFDFLPSGDPDDPDEPVFGDFIAQICSAPGCPPPEYTVICDCDSCIACPDGTCAVECDGHICCYNTETGISVKQINIDNYCESET